MIKKVSKKGWLIAFIVFVVAIGACVVDAFIPDSPVKYISSVLRIKIPKGTTVISDDYSEPSFPTGDGYSWTILQVPPEKITEFVSSIEASPIWKPLPLSSELASHEHYIQPAFMFGVEGEIPITTSEGYYVFIDRQDNTIKPFYERPSFNYTFGLFNKKDGKLYFWNLDT
jgi:hypothetical protein